MHVLALIFNWFLGLLFLIFTVSVLFYATAAAVPLLFLTMMFLPPVRRFLHKKTKRSFPSKAKKIIVPILVLAALVLIGDEVSRRNDEKAAIALQKRIDVYLQKKTSIVDSINTAISLSDFEIAIAQIDRYAFAEDSDLVAIRHIATEKQLEKIRDERRNQILKELRGVPAMEFARNKELYGELLKMFPDNATYRARYDDYSTKLSMKQEQERLVAERAAREAREKAARKERIEAQFSAWDGAHRNLTKIIKASMNDPDSFKHVKTVYWDMIDHLIVQETFRGKNAFGGVVVNTVKAKVSLDGQVLEIIDQW